jgi:hypothetical protein
MHLLFAIIYVCLLISLLRFLSLDVHPIVACITVYLYWTFFINWGMFTVHKIFFGVVFQSSSLVVNKSWFISFYFIFIYFMLSISVIGIGWTIPVFIYVIYSYTILCIWVLYTLIHLQMSDVSVMLASLLKDSYKSLHIPHRMYEEVKSYQM